MKKAKKVLALLLCAVLLVGASVMGTLAWLTDKTETVTNTFTAGEVDITLKESPYDPEDDSYAEPAEGTKNSYPAIPGAAYQKEPVVADFKCEKCGSDMVQRSGRFGTFFACIRYPECNFTKQKTREIGVDCPKCGSKIVMKTGRNKTVFYSCERYPDCDFSSWDLPTNEKCPDCGGMLFRKKGQSVLVCRTENCGFKKPYVAENTEE